MSCPFRESMPDHPPRPIVVMDGTMLKVVIIMQIMLRLLQLLLLIIIIIKLLRPLPTNTVYISIERSSSTD